VGSRRVAARREERRHAGHRKILPVVGEQGGEQSASGGVLTQVLENMLKV
jgi:hypothetical protein